ncbi:MAG: GDP-mannose 4,6-dehydratase [Candidatus Hermodarchaeota archaeon]
MITSGFRISTSFFTYREPHCRHHESGISELDALFDLLNLTKLVTDMTVSIVLGRLAELRLVLERRYSSAVSGMNPSAYGFIGKAFIDYHLAQENVVEDIFTVDIISVKNKNHFQCDATVFEKLNKIIQEVKPDEIYNFSGSFSNIFEKDYLNNVIVTKNIFDSIVLNENYNCKILINGSAAEYGFLKDINMPIKENHPLNPISSYGLTKIYQTYLAITYFLRNDVQVYIARPFNIIGYGISTNLFIGRLLEGIKNNIKNKDKIVVGNLNNERDYLDIEDLIRAYDKIMNYGSPGEIYNIGSGISIKMQNLFDMFLKLFGIATTEVEINKNFTSKYDVPKIIADISKLSKLEWAPKITLEESIIKIKKNMVQKRNK